MTTPKNLTRNLKMLRAVKKLNQQSVAELAGITREAYSNIENGKVIPRVNTLQNIAKALDVSLKDLVAQTKSLNAVRFRALKTLYKRDFILANISKWLDNFNYLENILNNQQKYLFESLAKELNKSNKKEKAMYAADKARNLLGLSKSDAIRDVCGLIEASGIKILKFPYNSYNFFGLSIAVSDGGPAIVVNIWDRIPVERWIFSAVHELGHLILHLDAYNIENITEDKHEEYEANLFASYFLMPQETFEDEWEETYGLQFYDRVIKVKRIFKVSYKTILYRLVQTGKAENNIWQQFQFLQKGKTGETLRRCDEPKALIADNFLASLPEKRAACEPYGLNVFDFIEDRLARLVREAIERELISISRGAEILDIDIETMRAVVSQ